MVGKPQGSVYGSGSVWLRLYTLADQEVEREARPGPEYDLQSLSLLTTLPLLINTLPIQIQTTTHCLPPQTLELSDGGGSRRPHLSLLSSEG